MFEVVVPFAGVAGWQYLKATEDRQKAAFEESPTRLRDVDYFRDNIANISSVEEFVQDPQLIRVALGAFGLSEDRQNTAFIRTVIEEGTEDSSALANRLADKRYLEFAEAFSTEKLNGAVGLSEGDISGVIASYLDLQYEESVGITDSDLRVALQLERELSELAASDSSVDTQYFRILGNPPLRLAFETAFGLPSSFSAIDIDRQVDVLKTAVGNRFGDPAISTFQDPTEMQNLIQLFLVRSSAEQINTSNIGARTALQLLQT